MPRNVSVNGEPVATESDLDKLQKKIRKNQIIFFILGVLAKIGFDLLWY